MGSADGKGTTTAQRIRDDRIRAEAWLAQHLWNKTGVDFQAGVTQPAQRTKRLCTLLTERGLTDQTLGRFNDRPESYRDFLKRALGIDL